MKARYLSLILCAFPVLGSAETGTAVGGPVAGFVFDQKAQALRPMLGMPGAAYLGGAALGALDAAAVSPDGSSALAVREGKLVLITGLKAEVAAVAVEGALESAARIAWSADGLSAALYSPAGRVQVLRKLNATPEAGEAVDVSGLTGAVAALACAGDGVLLGLADEAAGGVYFVKEGAEPKLLAAAARPSGMAVAASDLFFTDQERGQVWQVAGFSQDATPMLFAEGMASPVGVQAAGNRLFVANSGDSTLEVFNLTARTSAGRLALDAAPAMLESCGSRTAWLLNAAGAAGEPAYILDGGENPAVYFVPAGREE